MTCINKDKYNTVHPRCNTSICKGESRTFVWDRQNTNTVIYIQHPTGQISAHTGYTTVVTRKMGSTYVHHIFPGLAKEHVKDNSSDISLALSNVVHLLSPQFAICLTSTHFLMLVTFLRSICPRGCPLPPCEAFCFCGEGPLRAGGEGGGSEGQSVFRLLLYAMFFS